MQGYTIQSGTFRFVSVSVHVLSEQLCEEGTVCVCFCGYESVCMSNACMQRQLENVSTSATLI